MTGRELGLGIQADKRPGEYAPLAALAEHHGVDVLGVYGDLRYQPPIGPLLEMAAATRRVRLGPACLNPYTMHPYEIAGQTAYLDLASQGRAYLGLARGTWLDDIGVDQPAPLDHLADAAAVVRELLSDEGAGFEGSVFRLARGTRLAYRPLRARVPLLIGTWGPRTMDLAGRVADEVKIGGSANPDMVTIARDRLGDRATATGIVIGAVSVVDEDGEAARRLARTEVAMYLAVVAELDPTFVVDPDLLVTVRNQVAAGDGEAAGRSIPDPVLDRFAFAGTPGEVADQVDALFDAGATRVELGTPHGLTAARGIDLIGSAVVPRLALR